MDQFSVWNKKQSSLNVKLASNRDYNHGAVIWVLGCKQVSVAPERTWGPQLFFLKFKFH